MLNLNYKYESNNLPFAVIYIYNYYMNIITILTLKTSTHWNIMALMKGYFNSYNRVVVAGLMNRMGIQVS